MIPTKQNKKKFSDNKNFVKLQINGEVHEPSPMTLDDEVSIDQPNLSVNKREIRISWLAGTINMSELEITPINIPKSDGGPRTEIAKNTFIGSSCLDDPLNCLFNDGDLDKIKTCTGKFVKIGGRAVNQNMACMNKCIEKDYDSEDKCNLFCPETLTCKNDKTKWICQSKEKKIDDEPEPPAE